MFSPTGRDIPQVDNMILSQLSPRELVRSKRVSKAWHMAIKRYIKYLQDTQHEVMKQMFQESLVQKVPCFAEIKLPRNVVAITVHDKTDVYILSGGSIKHFDLMDISFKPELTFVSPGPWHYQRIHTTFSLSISSDGQQFTVKEFMLSKNYTFPIGTYVYEKKTLCGHSSLVLQESDITNFIATTAVPMQRDSFPTADTVNEFFLTFYTALHGGERLSDVVWLQNRSAAIFAVSYHDNYHNRFRSRVYGIKAGRHKAWLLAEVPIEPLRLHVHGTRVLCYPSDGRGGKMIVFDFWNPDSVRRGDLNIVDVNLGPRGGRSLFVSKSPQLSNAQIRWFNKAN